MSKGLVIVVSAPSGGGKGTILKELFERNSNFKFSVSATTRNPRPGEVDGQHYYFIDKPKFQELIDNDKMLEHAEYCGNFYGTPREPIEKAVDEGYDIVLEIEVQGGAQIKKKIPECVSVFITPPSMEVLEKRLRNRGTETDEVIKNRLNTALSEIPHAKDYDYIVVNDKLEDAVAELESIIKAEKLKYSRNTDLEIFKDISKE
jgi:guanylate kinase